MAIGETLFFAADDGVHGGELWKSDGTAAGTVMVADITPGSAGSFSGSGPGTSEFEVMNGSVFFFVGFGGRQLWKSDGTQAGTVLVKEFNASAPFRQHLVVGNTLYFVGNDTASGSELWKTDGTSSGTVLVKDIDPGPGLGLVGFRQCGFGGIDFCTGTFFHNMGGIVFFRASDGTSGFELWKSNGTEAGTSRVKDIQPGPPNGMENAAGLVAANTFYFHARPGPAPGPPQIWKTNGTEAGTVSAEDGGPFLWDRIRALAAGTTILFAGSDAIQGTELWKTDGTIAGTVLVRDIGASGGFSSNPQSLTAVGNTLFFVARDESHGNELWKSDGTPAGTVLVKDIRPGPGDSIRTLAMAAVNGILFFVADDGTSGDELWKSDGTAAGTVLVKDLNPGAAGSQISEMVDVGGTLFFEAGGELWKSNGAAAGTVLVKDINWIGASNPTNLTNVFGTLFFIADDAISGRELWKSNGTFLGTLRVKDIRPGPGSSMSNEPLVVWNGGVAFCADNGINGVELWKSNGKTAETVQVKDIRVGANSSAPCPLTSFGPWLLFGADNGVNGRELWRSNLLPEGTELVKDISPVGSSNPANFVLVNGRVIFSATNPVSGVELG